MSDKEKNNPGMFFLKTAFGLAGLVRKAQDAIDKGEKIEIENLFSEANEIMRDPDREEPVIDHDGPAA